jgi:hypothetical protein
MHGCLEIFTPRTVSTGVRDQAGRSSNILSVDVSSELARGPRVDQTGVGGTSGGRSHSRGRARPERSG